MTTNKPLAKALHTVTVVARLAGMLQRQSPTRLEDETAALAALAVLGYSEEQARMAPALFAACVKAARS